MKIIFMLSAALLLLLIVWIGVYVLVKKQKDTEVNKMTLVVSIIGILISACFSICSMPSVFEASDKVLSSNVSSEKEKSESKDNYYKFGSEKTTEESSNSSIEPTINNSDETRIPTAGTISDQKNSLTGHSSEETNTSKNGQKNTCKTTPLCETKTYSQDGSITREEIASDPRGNTYNNAYVFWAEYSILNTGGGYYDKPYLEKYLGGMYDEFTMKIIPYKDFDKYNKNIEAVVKIYADEKLIYTSNSITRKTNCEEINLSIRNVDYLKIELNAGTDLTSYYNQYSVILYDAKLTTK